MASSWQSSCFMDQKRFGKTGSSVIALWHAQWCAFAKPYTFSFPTSSMMFLNLESCTGKGSWIFMDFWHFWMFLDYALNANMNCSVFADFVFLTLPGAKCTQSVFSGILWLHPCWRLRTPDQSMAIVWTTWESDAWQAFANYIKNYQESNYILNYLHVYEIYATAAVWLITESQKMQGFKTTAKCRSMLTISVNHNTVEYVSYIKHTFLFVDISWKHIDIVIC